MAATFDGDAVHDAMSFLDASKTEAYRQACAACPELIQTESPHDQFLRFCKHNAYDAAARLADYWSERLDTFGPKLAFIPATEAVQPDVYDYLSKGVAVLLPTKDSKNRPVYYLDRSRVPRKTAPDDDVHRRSTFFLYQWLSQHALASNGEFIMMMSMDPMAKVRVDATRIPKINRLFEFMCVKPVEINIVSMFEGGSRKIFSSLIPMLIERVKKNYYQAQIIRSHAGTQDEIVASLEKHGLNHQGMPTTIGGKWSYESDWPATLHAKLGMLVKASSAPTMTVELKKPPAMVLKKPEPAASSAAVVLKSAQNKRAPPPPTSSEEETADQVLRRIRDRNVEYSRRKRARQKEKVENLQAKALQLESENTKLRAEESRLKGLVQRAQELVRTGGSTVPQANTAPSLQAAKQQGQNQQAPTQLSSLGMRPGASLSGAPLGGAAALGGAGLVGGGGISSGLATADPRMALLLAQREQFSQSKRQLLESLLAQQRMAAAVAEAQLAAAAALHQQQPLLAPSLIQQQQQQLGGLLHSPGPLSASPMALAAARQRLLLDDRSRLEQLLLMRQRQQPLAAAGLSGSAGLSTAGPLQTQQHLLDMLLQQRNSFQG